MALAEPRKVPLTGEASQRVAGGGDGDVRGGDGEGAGRVVAAPASAFQVDFGPGVEIAVFLQRGVAFVTADEAGGESEGTAGGTEKYGEVAAGAFAVPQDFHGFTDQAVWNNIVITMRAVHVSLRQIGRETCFQVYIQVKILVRLGARLAPRLYRPGGME